MAVHVYLAADHVQARPTEDARRWFVGQLDQIEADRATRDYETARVEAREACLDHMRPMPIPDRWAESVAGRRGWVEGCALAREVYERDERDASIAAEFRAIESLDDWH